MTPHRTPTATRGTTPAEVLDRLLALSMLVTADLSRFEEVEEVSAPRLHLLWQLGLAGPSTQRALADALEVTPRNITGLVDGLVRSGHVTREPHPTDRRATLVTLTTAGTDFVARLRAGHVELADRLFGHLDDRRLADVGDVLGETLERFAALVEEEAT